MKYMILGNLNIFLTGFYNILQTSPDREAENNVMSHDEGKAFFLDHFGNVWLIFITESCGQKVPFAS